MITIEISDKLMPAIYLMIALGGVALSLEAINTVIKILRLRLERQIKKTKEKIYG
jgi:hypothetical protein